MVAVAVLLGVGWLAERPSDLQTGNVVLYGLMLVGPMLAGALAGRWTGRASVAALAGLWCGMVLAVVAAVGLLSRDLLLATRREQIQPLGSS